MMSRRRAFMRLDEVSDPSCECIDPRPPGSHRPRWLRTPVLGVLLAAVAAALAVGPSHADLLADTWESFERSLATFEPVGRHLLNPIEKKVPGLTLTGSYYFWGDILVTEDERVGFRHKDFRALQAQNLLELELRYRVSESVELTSVNHILYDSVYDIQSSSGLFAAQVNEDFRVYHDFERIARELYVSYRTPRLDVVIGKQQIVWGKMDGRFIDVINAIDARESVQLEADDYELRRLPVWMANVTYFFGRSSLNFLWIADFESDQRPDYGSPWFSPLVPPEDTIAKEDPDVLEKQKTGAGDTILHEKRPAWDDVGDHEFAVRLDMRTGSVTWGLIYYYAWDRAPDDRIVGRRVDAEDVPHLVFSRRHFRLHHFGVTADYASALSSIPLVGTLPLVVRVEALLTSGVRFADLAKQAAARHGALNSGLSKRETLRAGIALELALPHNTTVIFQPSFFYTFDWGKSFGEGFGGAVGDEWALVPVLYIEHPLRATRDRLRLSGTIAPYLSGPKRGLQGVKTRLVASYEFSQFVKGSLIYTDYSGGGQTDLYGQYREWDNIGVEVQYEF